MQLLLASVAVLEQPHVGESFSSLLPALSLNQVVGVLTASCQGCPLRGGLRSFPTLTLHNCNFPLGYTILRYIVLLPLREAGMGD